MSKLSDEARPAVEKLLQADESQLLEKLGMRAKALSENVSVAGSFDPDVSYSDAEMGTLDDVREFGRRLLNRWNREAYKLVCGSDTQEDSERKELLDALGVSEVAAAAVLAGLLVTHLGISAAIASVVAAIIIKRFFKSAYEEFCDTWKESLAAD